MKQKTLLLLFMLVGLNSVWAQTKGSFEKPITFNSTTYQVAYYVPNSYSPSKKYKLIVALHGCGLSSKDMRDSYKSMSDSLDAILLCPGFNKSQMTGKNGKIITDAIAQCKSSYSIDTNFVYLSGFSCNGQEVFKQGWNNIYPFRGLIPLNAWTPSITKDYNFKSKTPTCICTGSLDGSNKNNKILYDSLISNKGKGKLIEMPGIGHLHSFPGRDIYLMNCVKWIDSFSLKHIESCDSFITQKGLVLRNTGLFHDTFINAKGLDSIIHTKLVIKKSDFIKLGARECNKYKARSGKVFYKSGIVHDTLPKHNGCFRNFTINLTILENTYSQINRTACVEYTTPSGKLLNRSGTYLDTIRNKENCDSIITIDLTILNQSFDTIIENTCEKYTAPSGRILTNSGFYNDTLQNILGCDSIIHIDLRILKPSSSKIDRVACDSFLSPTGKFYFASGVYLDTIANATNCDSIITTNLKILPSISPIKNSVHDTTICKGEILTLDAERQANVNYKWNTGDDTKSIEVSKAGTYFVTVSNEACQATDTFNIAVTSIDTTLSRIDKTLKYELPADSLQWLDCNKDFSAISGENSSTFSPKVNGDYAVEIAKNNCIDTSSCHQVIVLGVDLLNFPLLEIYPNPSEGSFKLELGKTYDHVKMSIYNSNGQKVHEIVAQQTHMISYYFDGNPGVYHIELQTKNLKSTLKWIKK